MIIIGYQGIGKSTLANNGNGRYIDLESSNFFINGKRRDDWYKEYAKIAVNLDSQGFDVFVSSHKVVQDEIHLYNGGNNPVNVIVITPDQSLEIDWIKKLKDRYENTGLEKDKKALLNAQNQYQGNVKSLITESGFPCIIIKSMNYDLKKIVDYCKKTLFCTKEKSCDMGQISLYLPEGKYTFAADEDLELDDPTIYDDIDIGDEKDEGSGLW